MKKHLLLLATLGLVSLQAQIGISDNSDFAIDPVDANAVLELRSSSKGLLFPRLNNAQVDALDGDQTAASLTPGMTVYNTETKKFLGWDGEKWQDLGYEGAADIPNPVNVGSIIVTEIMINPSAVEDKLGEWFELYNTTNEDLNLKGCTFSKTNLNYSFDINGDLVIPSNDYIAIGSNLNVATNGGATLDYSYGYGPATTNYPLGNTADNIILSCSATEIDKVAYDDTFFSASTAHVGSSIYLNSNAFNATDNDLGANWLVSTTSYGDGDNGTPSEANEAAPVVNSLFGFSASTLTVEEDDFNTTTIQLSPASPNVASVDINISDINALGTLGTDYDIEYNSSNISQFPFTINFAANATASQDIIIYNYNDTDEVNETATLSLENATGTNVALGTNTTLAITFNDDDSTTTPSTGIGQNFDDLTTWGYTSSIPEFNVSGDIFDVISINDAPNLHTNTTLEGNIMYFQDLLNGNGGLTSGSFLDITFTSETITNQTSISFDYDVFEFDNGDTFKYKIVFDGGTTSFITLPNDNFGTISQAIPAGTNTVQLILQLKQNGGSDGAAIDNIILQ